MYTRTCIYIYIYIYTHRRILTFCAPTGGMRGLHCCLTVRLQRGAAAMAGFERKIQVSS